MIVRQATLPWIPGQGGTRRGSARSRAGMGDTQTLSFPWLVPAPGATLSTAPGCLAGSGPLAPGENYCGAAAVTTADNWDSKTATGISSVCFQALFPWVGQYAADGSCVPVVNLPSPWPVIITAGLGAFLGYKLLGGGR